jgi:hypothetical protein
MDTYHILNFSAIFVENAFCFSKRLNIDIIKDFVPLQGHTYILFGSHEQAVQLNELQNQNTKIRFIIINMEPPESPSLRNKYYISLMRNNIVFDYSLISKTHLETLGIRCYSMYFPEFINSPNHQPRPIDILFVGSRTARREAVYQKLKERYPNKKIEFHMDWKHTDHSDMKKLLQSAKTVINIPFYDSGILETHRIHSALSAGCHVISLYSGQKETDDFYSKYIYFCHDYFEFFDAEPPVEKKLSYENLISSLSDQIHHANWIISQLIKN